MKYIFGQGALVLRCHCKHKAVEHRVKAPHKCDKGSCGCKAYVSPWVCNCGHGWASHEQRFVSLVPGESPPAADMKGVDGLVRGNDVSAGLAGIG
jgi:hypothetical protein